MKQKAEQTFKSQTAHRLDDTVDVALDREEGKKSDGEKSVRKCQENERGRRKSKEPGTEDGSRKHESAGERERGRKLERERKRKRETERSMKACFWWDSKSQHLFGWGSEKSSVSPCSARGNAIPGCMGFYEKQLYVEKGRWREPEKERQQGKEGEQE